MAITGFYIDRDLPGLEDNINTRMSLVNATQYTEGDALKLSTTSGSAGLLLQVAAGTDPGQFVYMTMRSARQYLRPAVFNNPVYNEAGLVLDVDKTPLVFANQFAAATYDGTACLTNTVNNQVQWVGTGTTAATDFLGGTIYIPQLNQQGVITTLSVSGGSNGTYTATVAGVKDMGTKYEVTAPTGGTQGGFSQAPTVGNTVRVVPWAAGYGGGVQFQATNPQQGISVTIAGKTGGVLYIFDVDLFQRIVYVKFNTALLA